MRGRDGGPVAKGRNRLDHGRSRLRRPDRGGAVPGETAYFPASAFAVARAAQCPVLALFVPKTGVFSYAFEMLLLPAPAREDRGSIRAGVRRFAEALDSFAQRHPDQCFLFADIWRKGAS